MTALDGRQISGSPHHNDDLLRRSHGRQSEQKGVNEPIKRGFGVEVEEEGEMFVHGLVRPLLVRTESPTVVDCLPKFGFRTEEEHTLSKAFLVAAENESD